MVFCIRLAAAEKSRNTAKGSSIIGQVVYSTIMRVSDWGTSVRVADYLGLRCLASPHVGQRACRGNRDQRRAPGSPPSAPSGQGTTFCMLRHRCPDRRSQVPSRRDNLYRLPSFTASSSGMCHRYRNCSNENEPDAQGRDFRNRRVMRNAKPGRSPEVVAAQHRP
jgi:hypothetical protein